MWTRGHGGGTAPHGGPSGWWRQWPEGQRAFIYPHLRKARCGHLNPVVASPKVLSGAPKQALPQGLHCLGHPLLLPHGSISPCLAPAHPTRNSIPNPGAQCERPSPGQVMGKGEGTQDTDGLQDPTVGQGAIQPVSAAGRQRESPALRSEKSHC